MYPVTEHYHAAVITLKGEFFGSLHGETFNQTLAALRANGVTNVVVDLSQTTLMDSSGIGVLLAAAETLRTAGGDIRLAEMETRLRNLFLMTRLLGDVFETYNTVDEAVASFASALVSA